MTKRFALVLAVLSVPTLVLVAYAAPNRHHKPPRPPVQECPTDCGEKLDHGPWRIVSAQPVTSVCIKAGRQLYSFTSDGTSACFTVTGLGTTHVSVRRERGERGDRGERDCEDISSVTFYHDCGGGGGPGGNLPG